MTGATTALTCGAARRATSFGTMTSVSSGPCGPCCSVEPTGTMTVCDCRRKASTSGFVISPRNTVAGFIGCLLVPSRSGCRRSGDGRRQFADALDPARHDIAGLEMAVRAGRGREPRWCAGRDQVARLEPDVPADVGEDLVDRVAHVARPAILDRLAVERAAEADVGRIEFVGRHD